MNVVFLDVDGVLNYDGCKDKFGQYIGVDDALVERLARIVKSANAQIVLTSSWKELWLEDMPPGEIHPMAKYLLEKLKKQGLHIADRTDDNGWDRGKGIRKWMRHVSISNIDGWVVLDDEIFRDYESEGIVQHLVRTNFCCGLTDADVDLAIKILNEKK